MAPGRPVQVVTVTEDVDHGPVFELNEDALREVLLQDNVKDLPVAVVSVAGRMRQGKSFFLNFVIQYLKNKLRDTDDYALLDGFEWRCGPDGCTTGILVWSELFVVEGPYGKKVAVLLMDTQGTFDTATTMRECSTLFALSTMLSSLQIYNVMQDVKRDDLDSLQLFVEYGRTAQRQGYGSTRPFKGLLFLVRDWGWPEHHEWGAKGGEDFINKRLTNKDDIRNCFDEMSCFLLPYPWKKVVTDRESLVNLSGITDHFKELIRELLSDMLNWNQLESMLKEQLDGEKVVVKDILTYFKAYLRTFEGNEMPTPQSAFDANKLVSITKAFETGLNTFEELRKALAISVDNSPSQEHEILVQSLRQCQTLAIQEFESRATLGVNVKVMDQYLVKLYQDTDVVIDSLVHLNNVKKINEEAEKKIIEAEHEKVEAERKRLEANMKEQHALQSLVLLTLEKEEAERKRVNAELMVSESAEENTEIRRELTEAIRRSEQLIEDARRQIKEANDAKEAANRIKEEAERKRSGAEEKKKESGGTDNALKMTGRVICDVVSAASSFMPGYFMGAVRVASRIVRRWLE